MEGFENGYWYEPTIITDVNHDMKVVKEEIFGPVVVVMKFKDEKEAIKMANDSEYRTRISCLDSKPWACDKSIESDPGRNRHGELSVLRFPWYSIRRL